jgi:hypothetical protein
MVAITNNTSLNDPAFRIHPISWNEKHGRNSRADGVAQCLIASLIKGHPFSPYGKLLNEVCFEQIRRADKWETRG